VIKRTKYVLKLHALQYESPDHCDMSCINRFVSLFFLL